MEKEQRREEEKKEIKKEKEKGEEEEEEPRRKDPLYGRETPKEREKAERRVRIKRMLNQPIPEHMVKQKPARGSYVSGGDVVRIANSIFGQDGWKEVLLEKTIQSNPNEVWCEVWMKVVVEDFGERIDVGFGVKPLGGKLGYGETRSLAVKSAFTDARKRAMKNFGEALGNSLYKKDK